MNAFQTCRDTSDIIPLYIPQQLYLKPVAKIFISLQLPSFVKTGKSISHWEIMEKIRELIAPEEFVNLKVYKSTVEVVRFEADLDVKKKVPSIVNKLNNKTIKLKNFSDLMRLKAATAKSDFPNRQVWDGFFQESKDMNEIKPGERPDTVHISNLPTKWFVPYHLLNEEDLLPSEKIFYKIFEKFGPIRYVDIPICDPYRNSMKHHISGIKNSSWDNKTFFEGYVQYKDYLGFTKCMDFLRDMNLLHKDEDQIEIVSIKVDFDRSKHLSEASVRRREIVRDRLVKKQQEKEEKEKNELEEKKRKEEEEKQKELNIKLQKEQRRKLREEKRKAAILEKLKIKGADEINAKIAKEEKKLLKAQRKLESIRLIEELFRRIKDKKVSETVQLHNSGSRSTGSELQSYKNESELEVQNQKQKLHTAIQGRVMLKTALQDDRLYDYSSSSSEEMVPNVRKPLLRDDALPSDSRLASGELYDPVWYGYPYHIPPAVYQPPIRGHPVYNTFRGRGRGYFPKGPQYSRGGYFTKRSRGYNFQYRGGYQGRNHYPPEIEEEYIKYFSKFLHDEHDDRSRASSSKSRRSRSRSRRSRSRSVSRRRSCSRDRTYSRSSSRSRSRSNSRSRRFNSRRRSRSASLHSRTRRSNSRRGSRSRKSRSKSNERQKDRNKSSSRRSRLSSKTRTPEVELNRRSDSAKRNEIESPSAKSVDSSKFISPKRMRRERSNSWSSPKLGDGN